MEAIAASAPEMPKVSIATPLTLMPISLAPSRFCAIASMVVPTNVRLRKKYSAPIITIEVTIISNRWAVMVTPPKLRMPVSGEGSCKKSEPNTNGSRIAASIKNSTPMAAIMA